jgi:hypothetical protein
VKAVLRLLTVPGDSQRAALRSRRPDSLFSAAALRRVGFASAHELQRRACRFNTDVIYCARKVSNGRMLSRRLPVAAYALRPRGPTAIEPEADGADERGNRASPTAANNHFPRRGPAGRLPPQAVKVNDRGRRWTRLRRPDGRLSARRETENVMCNALLFSRSSEPIATHARH